MNILQKIFKEHYEEMIYLQYPRDSVIENVDKMINCGNPSWVVLCTVVDTAVILNLSPFDAKVVFARPANKYSIDRTTSMSFKIIKTPHRHCRKFSPLPKNSALFLKRPFPFKLPFFSRQQCNSPYVFQDQ